MGEWELATWTLREQCVQSENIVDNTVMNVCIVKVGIMWLSSGHSATCRALTGYLGSTGLLVYYNGYIWSVAIGIKQI